MKHQLRRTFLRNGLIATGAFSPFSTTLLAQRSRLYTPSPSMDTTSPGIQQLLQVAIDAAIAAGASYVDCRLTHTKQRSFLQIGVRDNRMGGEVKDTEDVTIGIRSLVAGYWGATAGPIVSRDEMAQLARESVVLAKGGAATGKREVVLADRPVVKNGTWVMPIAIDPFALHPSEVVDRLAGLQVFVNNLPMTGADPLTAIFQVQTKEFLASDGCSFTQKTYLSNGGTSVTYAHEGNKMQAEIESLSPAGVGFELFDEVRLREEFRKVRETLIEDIMLPVNPVDVGRYNALIRTPAVAGILSSTIGAATEVDRVLGHEANATGTSYLKDLEEDVGTFIVGNSLINVTADRTMTGGAATVQWDDEGVAAERFPLIQRGVVTDLQTNREGAGWMTPVYARTNVPVRSRGCASAPNAVDPSMVHTSNLSLQPTEENASEEALMKSLDNGIYLSQLWSDTDFQQLNGWGFSRRCFDIKKGKKAAILANVGILFRAPEFWKSVQALGDTASAQTVGVQARKGQPQQRSYHSISAVPMIIKDLNVIDFMRKA